MKRIFFALFAIALLAVSCTGNTELSCFEFTIKKVEVTESDEGITERELEPESFMFCDMTEREAADEARAMSKVDVEEKVVDGKTVRITTTSTATYKKIS